MTMRRRVLGVCKASAGMLMLALLCNTAMAGALGRPPANQPIPGVPEIDPSSILSALALLGGGLMIVTDRCRAK